MAREAKAKEASCCEDRIIVTGAVIRHSTCRQTEKEKELKEQQQKKKHWNMQQQPDKAISSGPGAHKGRPLHRHHMIHWRHGNQQHIILHLSQFMRTYEIIPAAFIAEAQSAMADGCAPLRSRCTCAALEDARQDASPWHSVFTETWKTTN